MSLFMVMISSTLAVMGTSNEKMLTPDDVQLFQGLTTFGGYKLEDIQNLLLRSKAKKPDHFDIVSKTNTALRIYAQKLQNTQSASDTLTTMFKELGDNLYTVANEQVATGQSLIKQKDAFLKLFEAGLRVQLSLNNKFPNWLQQFDEQSKQVINEFIGQAKNIINNGLIILARMYMSDGATPLDRAGLMLSAILIYPVAVVGKNASALKLQNNIFNLQNRKEQGRLNNWIVEVGINHPELQEIFAKEDL